MSECWDTRLERAKRNGYFTFEDVQASRSWRSCSIGETFLILAPNYVFYGPATLREVARVAIDDVTSSDAKVVAQLVDLGCIFDVHVRNGNISGAKLTHETIKRKMAELLKVPQP